MVRISPSTTSHTQPNTSSSCSAVESSVAGIVSHTPTTRLQCAGNRFKNALIDRLLQPYHEYVSSFCSRRNAASKSGLAASHNGESASRTDTSSANMPNYSPKIKFQDNGKKPCPIYNQYIPNKTML